MMLHAPMNTAVAIAASALGALYLQVLVSIVVMFGYHVAFKPIEIADPSFAFSMLMLSWVLGLGTGMVLLAIRPWAPRLAPILMTILTRVNFFASGKMMVGNALSFSLLHLFDWNPLFHIIDQMRGAIFVNYIPRNSSVTFALWWSFALIVIGLMGEFYSRRNISASWAKR
jgi:ABC-type polysaccharide/polyol phosphate export permease